MNELKAGQSEPAIQVLTVNTSVAPLFTFQKPVKAAILQNLSITDTITLGIGGSGQPAQLTAGQGIVLNPAQLSGYGGGSIELPNIDLSKVSAVTSTNDSQKLSVVYYT